MSEIRISVIGASMRSIMLFKYLKQNPQQGKIIGIFDHIPQRAAYLAKRYELADVRIYTSLQEATQNDQINTVFISTPDGQHVEPTTSALNAGKNVYIEKPLAITLEDCDEIITAAAQSQSIFYLGMNLRHSPVYEKLHEIIASGRLGKLLTIEANEYYHGGKTYFRRWNRLRKFSGGLWVTKACHDFDLLNWFAGGQPAEVFATSSLSHYKPNPNAGSYCRNCPIKHSCKDYFDIDNPKDCDWPDEFYELSKITEQVTNQWRDICLYNSDKDTFDNGMAIVKYDNDVKATYTLNVVSARNTRQLRLMGTEGAAEGDLADGIITFWKNHSDEKEVFDLKEKMTSTHGGADDQILDDFFECCRIDKKPRSSWADGRLGLKVSLAARQSCDANAIVKL